MKKNKYFYPLLFISFVAVAASLTLYASNPTRFGEMQTMFEKQP
jgi:hypothetical protein